MSTPAQELDEARRIGGIPVRNLYVMLAFAEALRDGLSPETCGALEDELPLSIIARLLSAKLRWLRRRGTPRSYRVREQVAAAPEGSIDFPATIRALHLVHDRVAFRVDELQIDTPQNQLLCAGVRALLRSPAVKDELRDQLRRQLPAFSGISYISNHEALRVRWRSVAGADSSYAEALGLARLAVLASLPDEGAHDRHWRKLLDDEAAMGLLFERFIRGFLKVEFRGRGSVRQPRFDWSAEEAHAMLPELRTDLVIDVDAGGPLCVGECKLYKSPLDGRSRGDKLRRDHLFQLHAYLAAAAETRPERSVEGLLIYGRVAEAFDCELELRRFPVRVRTLGLDRPWAELRGQLRGLWPET